MIIPIRALDGGEKDWTMIELQGEILHSQSLKEGFEFGKMRAQDKDGVKVELTIGYHQLIGKRVKLDKPFAVMKKVTVGDRVEYKVKGVIRYKYLFKQRPQAIISSPATGHGDG